MQTAVIVLNYNGKAVLGSCIRSVLKSEYEDFQLILVDNASKDGSIEAAEKEFSTQIAQKRIKIVKSSTNTGFAEGNNIGYRAVAPGTKYVVLLNYDAIVAKDWLGLLVQTMEEHPELGICGSNMSSDGKRPRTAREFLRLPKYTMTLSFEIGRLVPDPSALLVEGMVASGNGMIIRRKQFKTLFNPDYFAYAEDTDICLNAKMRGMKVGIRQDAWMTHFESVAKKSDKKISKIAVFNGTKNQIINFLVHYHVGNILRILPLFALTQLAHAAYQPQKIITMLKAYFWALTNPRRILRYRAQLQRERKVSDAELIREMSGIIQAEDRLSQGWQRSIAKVVNNISLGYCWIVRLKTVEYKKE